MCVGVGGKWRKVLKERMAMSLWLPEGLGTERKIDQCSSDGGSGGSRAGWESFQFSSRTYIHLKL